MHERLCSILSYWDRSRHKYEVGMNELCTINGPAALHKSHCCFVDEAVLVSEVPSCSRFTKSSQRSLRRRGSRRHSHCWHKGAGKMVQPNPLLLFSKSCVGQSREGTTQAPQSRHVEREFPKRRDPNSTLNSRTLIIRTPKYGTPHFRKLPYRFGF